RGELAYGGEQPDGTLIYLRSRTYDGTVGRFTSRDPVTAMIGQTDTTSPYAYGNNNPLNFIDPRGRWSLWDNVFSVLGALQGLGMGDCPPADNSTNPAHNKCFQGVLLSTRGYIEDDCLDAREYCLNALWNRKPRADRERAAQAFTINELNKRREGYFHRLWDDQFGFGTAASIDVDWEVKPPQGFYAPEPFRIDIVTNETHIFEVKDYKDAAQVEAQLGTYLFLAWWDYGINFDRGTELQDWANAFTVYESFWDNFFGGDDVYVWGVGNPAGHVYFAKGDKAPVAARVKADRKKGEDDQEQNPCTLCFPIPVIPGVPVDPVPVPVPVPVAL
ncbi:MAG TPA: RHS repeat-associated core domain-containing protein, partial [Kofleriaceae bacterium]